MRMANIMSRSIVGGGCVYDEEARKYVESPFLQDPYDFVERFYCDECGRELSAEVVEALERLME